MQCCDRLRSVSHLQLSRLFSTSRSALVNQNAQNPISNDETKQTFLSKIPKQYEIAGNKYNTDDWSNLSPSILRLIKRKIHREPGNPIQLITQGIETFFSDYRKFQFASPVVSLVDNFDSLLISPDHVSRSKSDTYYVNKDFLLRSHTSAHQAQCLKQLNQDNSFLCVEDVYRRDVVDSTHYPAFHQCELFHIFDQSQFSPDLRIFEKDLSSAVRTDYKQKEYTEQVTLRMEQLLKQNVERYIRYLLGNDVPMRWVPAYFPFTHPSFELEIQYNNKWVEMLGCGVVERPILLPSQHDQHIAFAVGFGLERLAMLKYQIPDIRLFWSKDSGFTSQFKDKSPTDLITYKPISAFPQAINDCSFWLPKDTTKFNENDFHELVRDIGGDLIEQVELIDQFNKKDRTSNCFRIIYRSHERTLTKQEVNDIHEKIKSKAVEMFNVELR